jgi:hypothetical protein
MVDRIPRHTKMRTESPALDRTSGVVEEGWETDSMDGRGTVSDTLSTNGFYGL